MSTTVPPRLPDRGLLRRYPELAALDALAHQAHLAIEALAAVYMPKHRDPVLLQHSRRLVDHAQDLVLAVEAYRRIIAADSTTKPLP